MKADPYWNIPFTEPFRWDGGFKTSMRPLLRTLLPVASEAEALLLYAVFNFDAVQDPNAAHVPEDRMRAGAGGLLRLLEQTAPRLIVAMERRSYALLKATITENHYAIGSPDEFPIALSIYGNPRRFHRRIYGFRIGKGGPLEGTVVVRLPQHPARMFTDSYAAACGASVYQTFLKLRNATPGKTGNEK